MGNINQFLLFLAQISVFLLILLALAYFAVKLLLLRARLRQKFVIYEVKPLQETLQSALSTQQLFASVHGLIKQRSFLDKLLGNSKNYSFEIVSTKDEGIRYMFRVNQEDAELIKRSLLSYLPGINVNEAGEYIPVDLQEKPHKIVDFKLSNHFAYPLNAQKALKEYDPIAYITGSMTKLSKNDLVSFQIVLSPIGKSTVSDINKIIHDIYSNNDLVSNLKNLKSDSLFLTFFKNALSVLIRLLTIPVGFLVFIASGGNEGPLPNFKPTSFNKKNDNIYQDELAVRLHRLRMAGNDGEMKKLKSQLSIAE